MGADIGDIVRKLEKTVEGVASKEKWDEEFRKYGIPAFRLWLRTSLPYLFMLGKHWDLDENQRMVAVKEWLARKKQLEEWINARLAEVAFNVAKRRIAPVIVPRVGTVPTAPMVV